MKFRRVRLSRRRKGTSLRALPATADKAQQLPIGPFEMGLMERAQRYAHHPADRN
jgi:hypothetical protein